MYNAFCLCGDWWIGDGINNPIGPFTESEAQSKLEALQAKETARLINHALSTEEGRQSLAKTLAFGTIKALKSD